MLLWFNGRIAGISGIFNGLLSPQRGMKRNIVALVAGPLFGFGLAVSHMVEPTKVLAFLDVAGNWDPSLLLVMAAGVAVTLVAFRLFDGNRCPCGR